MAVAWLLRAARQPGPVFAAALTILLVFYVATLLLPAAVLAHLSLPSTLAWRVTVIAAWRPPLVTVGVMAGTEVLIVALTAVAPAALPFFAVSAPVFLAGRAAMRAFARFS